MPISCKPCEPSGFGIPSGLAYEYQKFKFRPGRICLTVLLVLERMEPVNSWHTRGLTLSPDTIYHGMNKMDGPTLRSRYTPSDNSLWIRYWRFGRSLLR